MRYNKVPELPEKGSYIGLGHGVKVHKDGTVEAKGFRDSTLDGLQYDEVKDLGVKFHRAIDDETSVEYVPRTVKVYRTKVKRSFSIKNAFAVIKGKVRDFVLENLPRFKHSHKRLKNEIKKIIADKSKWTFSQKKGGQNWGQAYIDSTTFGPYNYDVKVKAASDLTFLNDVIVIKTGGFELQQPQNETIVYMSPHEAVRYEGDSQYITTGETIYEGVTDSLADATFVQEAQLVTFNQRELGVTNTETTYVPTSNMISIPAGETLAHGHSYSYHDDAVSYSETNDVPVSDTVVGSVYREYAESLPAAGEDTWDGIIPSGVWFRVESWAFQSERIGWAGNLEVVPVDSSIECSHEGTFTFHASDGVYQEARLKAEQGAEKKFYKSLNGYLVNKGIKNKNSKMLRYEKMRTRAAQNVYDGLSARRSQTISKTDATNLNYYDGTSKAYGGSERNTKYNYEKITQQKLQDAGFYGEEAIGIIPTDEQAATQAGAPTSNTWNYNEETESWEQEEGGMGNEAYNIMNEDNY